MEVKLILTGSIFITSTQMVICRQRFCHPWKMNNKLKIYHTKENISFKERTKSGLGCQEQTAQNVKDAGISLLRLVPFKSTPHFAAAVIMLLLVNHHYLLQQLSAEIDAGGPNNTIWLLKWFTFHRSLSNICVCYMVHNKT